MIPRTYTLGLTFYMEPELNDLITDSANLRRISKSEFIRRTLKQYFIETQGIQFDDDEISDQGGLYHETKTV